MLDATNQPPTIDWGNGGGTVALNNSQAHYFSSGELGFNDPDGDWLDHITILSLPAQGTLLLDGYYPVTSGETIDSYLLDYGYLVFVPDSEASTSYQTSFLFSVNDGQTDSLPASLTINVSVARNTPPTIAGSVHSLSLTSSKTLATADFGYHDADGNPLQWITITSLPESGTLLNDSDPVTVGTTIDAYDLDNGAIVYEPNPNATTSYVDTLSFTASDGETTSGTGSIAFNVSVTPNAAPSAIGSVVPVPASTTTTLATSHLGYSDPDGDLLQSITITALPGTGTLTLLGSPVAIGTNVTVQQIQAGYLAYAPNASNQSAHAAAFSFTTSDGNLSSAQATVTFNVAGNSNIAPVTSNLSLTVPESGWLMLSLEDFPYSDADGDELSHITILSLPSTASLTVYGYPVSIGEIIDAHTFYDGAVELYFESTTGGAMLASFSFSVSDGISSSASATLTATSEDIPQNRRPTTSTISLNSEINTTRWLATGDFPFTDPDGDLLHHVSILNIPPNASLTAPRR